MTSDFYEYHIRTVNDGERTLGTHAFDTNGDSTKRRDPDRPDRDGKGVLTTAKKRLGCTNSVPERPGCRGRPMLHRGKQAPSANLLALAPIGLCVGEMRVAYRTFVGGFQTRTTVLLYVVHRAPTYREIQCHDTGWDYAE